jgi:hypothetical protein
MRQLRRKATDCTGRPLGHEIGACRSEISCLCSANEVASRVKGVLKIQVHVSLAHSQKMRLKAHTDSAHPFGP